MPAIWDAVGQYETNEPRIELPIWDGLGRVGTYPLRVLLRFEVSHGGRRAPEVDCFQIAL
jgi:hypothetical protein